MADPILYGPDYSTYVRTSRLALEEKGVTYRLESIDFLHGGMPAEQVRRHPFGKVPAFKHDGFEIYETSAITRYVDEAFSGPALQPADPQGRARMMQIIAVIDSYTYQPVIWGIVVERSLKPQLGAPTDEQAIAAALPKAHMALQALERLAGTGGYLVDGGLSLADLHLAPIFAYFTTVPDAGPLLAETPRLRSWWEEIKGRPSMAKTQPGGQG
jgi:glutathione S-transferase